MRQSWSVNNLIDFVVRSIQRAQADYSPFYHLRFDRVFPDDFYAAMLDAMPAAGGYRALSGKAKLRNRTADGQVTRTKIDLFPEYIRHLPQKKRAVWDVAGRVLRSEELGKVFVERLAYLSSTNPDARHSLLLHHRALGHLLEGHHSPVLPAA